MGVSDGGSIFTIVLVFFLLLLLLVVVFVGSILNDNCVLGAAFCLNL